ncbi:hypothetical protein AVEN_117940-1 [Araneus ventricosus]|uniref:Uncharacterized protein n=1 Tax=Araneus ventricosus TaxID=182803 RepID=A0A4Y2KRS3_ARAVE|nr:hypothetical protein AVEN_117940-1 [Araneus ventricosus]
MPQEVLEWTRLLNQWLRQHATEDMVDRQIYRLLAIDGFEGFEAKDLRTYLASALNSKGIREEYRQHTRAVRSMYEWIDTRPEISSLMGTDSACVVFLAFLQLYESKLNTLLADDRVAMQTHRARRSAEGFLHRNASYYKDIRKVTEDLLRELVFKYEYVWKGQDGRRIGTELMTRLSNKKPN